MRLQYVSIPDSTAGKMRSDPSLAASLVMGGALAAMGQGDASSIQQAIQKKLNAMGMGAMFPRLARDDADDEGDSDGGGPRGHSSLARPDAVRGEMEKAWHGLHFVLCGTADEAPPPLGYLLSGGEELGDDLGYGPARYLKPDEVKAFRDALMRISDADFARRFDPAALERSDIYPNIWDEDRDELLEEYQMYFEQFKRDLDATLAAGEGLLIAMT
ncbi:MAG: YfbM family protein [Phycisphaerales bacterium]|nr:YfbM family protein [Phycisphaerales bacterium]